MIDPTLDRAVKTATVVRAAIENYFPQRPTCRNVCSLASYVIARVLQEQGHDAQFVGGSFFREPPIAKPIFGNSAHLDLARSNWPLPHAWVRSGAYIIDATLTQFIPTADSVAVLPVWDARYAGRTEPLEFVEMILPICGSSIIEAEAIRAWTLRTLWGRP